MAGRKRSRQLPQWADIRRRLHMRIKDAATELDVPVTYLRHLCHQNGFPNWPGKRIRYMKSFYESIGVTAVLPEVDAPEVSSRAWFAGPTLLAMIAERKKKEEEDMTRILAAPDANSRPGHGKLTTLNLIDKVGSSSSSEST